VDGLRRSFSAPEEEVAPAWEQLWEGYLGVAEAGAWLVHQQTTAVAKAVALVLGHWEPPAARMAVEEVQMLVQMLVRVAAGEVHMLVQVAAGEAQMWLLPRGEEAGDDLYLKAREVEVSWAGLSGEEVVEEVLAGSVLCCFHSAPFLPCSFQEERSPLVSHQGLAFDVSARVVASNHHWCHG
jgi:hypothetical protein